MHLVPVDIKENADNLKNENCKKNKNKNKSFYDLSDNENIEKNKKIIEDNSCIKEKSKKKIFFKNKKQNRKCL